MRLLMPLPKIHQCLVITTLSLAALTGCQSVHTAHLAQDAKATAPAAFFITGKIGITTQTANGKQGGSAFYAWSQKDNRFGIELTGALGLGATNIYYDGKTAMLISSQTGTITASTPDELLAKTTGWNAPISQLSYWIMGRPAPTDTDSQFESDKLISSSNAGWNAVFSYDKDTHPTKIVITHHNGHRVVMTIHHTL